MNFQCECTVSSEKSYGKEQQQQQQNPSIVNV